MAQFSILDVAGLENDEAEEVQSLLTYAAVLMGSFEATLETRCIYLRRLCLFAHA